ncbi:MAG: ComEC/Rec2 family competence protein [Caldisericaceae bacterium]|nr:ComEC/Rec2 family competence protein [Caldisericaceae bacterium]
MPGLFAFFTGISGIFAALSVSKHWVIAFLVFLLSGAFFVSLQKEKVLKLAGIAVFVIIFFNAFSGFCLLNKPEVPYTLNGKEITLVAKTADFSKQTIRPNSFRVSGIEINGENFSGNAKVYCGMKDPPPPYSKVKIRGKIRIYGQRGIINKLNGISYVVYAESVKILKANPVLEKFSEMRKRIAKNTLLSMKSSEAMLLLSSVSGISAMNYEEKKPFTETGTAHIFAVSGLHMGILGKSTEKLFSFAGGAGGGITIGILFLFVLLVGFRASALRAFLMFSISEAAKFTGREQIPINTLSFVALLILLVNPLLLFSISFQLSFLAIFGLVILSPKLYAQMPEKLGYKMLSQVISVQLVLYPVIAYYFHMFSPVSFFANLVVIPIMYLVLPVGIVQILLSLIGLDAAKLFAPVSNFVFGMLSKIVSLFSKIPLSSVNLRFNLIFMIIYILALVFFTVSLSKSKKARLIGASLLVMALFLPILFPSGFSITPLNLRGEDGFLISRNRDVIYVTSPTFLKSEEADAYQINKVLAENGVNKVSLLICDAPLESKESSALRILPSEFEVPDIILPFPETELSHAFEKTVSGVSNVHYVNDKSKISFDGIKFSLVRCGEKYAILVRENGNTYLLVGKGCGDLSDLPYADFVYIPENANIKNIPFGKVISY